MNVNKEEYDKIEGYMKKCCGESIHDEEHIYRVLYNALEIADSEENVDINILITACLLHDIARIDELKDKTIDHAVYGSEKAYNWLISNGFDESFSKKTAQCIKTHRYRGNNIPESIEAKILFDADKIDAAGFIGIARTLMYKGVIGEPLYVKQNGKILDGTDGNKSFFNEYTYKLSNVYNKLFTDRAKQMTIKMKRDARYFYETLYNDLNNSNIYGQEKIKNLLD